MTPLFSLTNQMTPQLSRPHCLIYQYLYCLKLFTVIYATRGYDSEGAQLILSTRNNFVRVRRTQGRPSHGG